MTEVPVDASPDDDPPPSHTELLRVNDLLIGLDDGAFEEFVKRCGFVEVAKGGTLIQEGDTQHSVVFVVEGIVRIVGLAEGMELNYRDIPAGGWFGEIAAIDKGGRSASAYAATDVTVATAPREVFLNLLLEHRHIAVKILERLASIVRQANQRMVSATSFSGVQRVYMKLLDLAQPDAHNDGQWYIPRMPTHEDLAVEAMTSKELVARAISQLMQMNVAKREKGQLRICNRETLKQLATQL